MYMMRRKPKMSNIDPQQLTSILLVVVAIMILILIVLAAVYFMLKLKGRKNKKEEQIQVKEKTETTKTKVAKEYSKESIFKFMEFDKIEDNMIVQKNGGRYLMAVECQGINYDLMSNAEKISVEEGFLQFLNTLRHPIQIYIQTRTVNLSDSINMYEKKVSDIKAKLDSMKDSYMQKQEIGGYAPEQMQKELYEITKQTNLYEYAKDVMKDTERMSLNKNVLNKKYYIIIPCYPADLQTGNFDKEELKNLAFSELYTKAQSIIRTLATCEVSGKIMNSNGLIDLLYVAYNRDESETYGVEKATRAGYYELYTTAPDVLDKKMKELNRRVEQEALQLANEKVIQARSQKEEEIMQMEESFEDLIAERAKIILEENQQYIGKKTAKKAKELLEQDTKEGGKKDAKKETTTTRRKRTTSTK